MTSFNGTAGAITNVWLTYDAMNALPKRISIIRKGPSFGDDFYKALDNLFLI